MTETEVLAHTIADATKISGLGRTTIYEAIGTGRLEAVKAGNRTLIVATSLRSFLANLPAANITTGRKAAADPQRKAPMRGAPGRLGRLVTDTLTIRPTRGKRERPPHER